MPSIAFLSFSSLIIVGIAKQSPLKATEWIRLHTKLHQKKYHGEELLFASEKG